MTTSTVAPVKITVPIVRVEFNDKCQPCGASALFKAVLALSADLPDGAELVYCGHHANDRTNKLLKLGIVRFVIHPLFTNWNGAHRVAAPTNPVFSHAAPFAGPHKVPINVLPGSGSQSIPVVQVPSGASPDSEPKLLPEEPAPEWPKSETD